MSQYPGDYCPSSSNSLMRRSTCGGEHHGPMGDLQIPSPLATLDSHGYLKPDYCCGKQQTVQVQIPNCMTHHYHQLQIPPPPGHGQYDLDLDPGAEAQYPPGGAMRLYMNQVASATGKEFIHDGYMRDMWLPVTRDPGVKFNEPCRMRSPLTFFVSWEWDTFEKYWISSLWCNEGSIADANFEFPTFLQNSKFQVQGTRELPPCLKVWRPLRTYFPQMHSLA